MAASTSLIEWILDLFRDPHARAAFQSDPDRYAAEHGFPNVSAADVHDALCVAADSAPAHSDNHDDDHRHHVPAPHHYSHHESAGHYLHDYVTNNYTTVVEHNTNIDDSVHQHVDTHGGDFDQTIDNDPVVASGNGAVAAGGAIQDSTITPGSGNVVGDNDQATTGNDNSTAFGTGDANNSQFHHVSTGSGSGLSVGGDGLGNNTQDRTATDVHNSGSGATSVDAAGPHATAGQYGDQSDHDNSTHSAYDDHSHTASSNTYDSGNTDHYNDSHDTQVHHA
jgi:hypothetical protein